MLAVTLVAVLAVVFTEKDTAALVAQRRQDLTASLEADAVSTYNTGRARPAPAVGWVRVPITPQGVLHQSSTGSTWPLRSGVLYRRCGLTSRPSRIMRR